jgi:hypothetical protein
MTNAPDRDDAGVESIGCPVHGGDVTCKVKYVTKEGVHTLVDFECNMEGMCGIPSWDPCPLYVAYLEGKATP